MDPIILFLLIAIGFVLLLLQWVKLSELARKTTDLRPILETLHLLQSDRGMLDRMLRDESSHQRQDQARDAQALRSEVVATLITVGDSMAAKVSGFSQANDQRAEQLRAALELRMQSFATDSGRGIDGVSQALSAQTEALSTAIRLLESQVDQRQLQQQNAVDAKLGEIELALRDQAQQSRQENGFAFKTLGQSISSTLSEIAQRQQADMHGLKATVDSRLATIQVENERKLEQMRQTVDEKLQGTLEARLGDSFRQLSERLEQVFSGLGEMKLLATGVGDLKRILSNVRTRGTWGEVQLGALIEQILAPEQIGRNVATSGSGDRVDYAVKLPGGGASGEPVWLPIDAQFPLADYFQLTEAAEKGDVEAVEKVSLQLEGTLRTAARSLSEKYLAPPFTTDFGILFLSTEGLYAEAMRRPGFVDALQRDYRVVLAGPSTLAALLNALQMGFRTLAIQQRSNEVWEILASVKAEFAKYAQVLAAVKKKLSQAQDTIDQAENRTRAIQRTLRDVKSTTQLGLPADRETQEEAADRRPILVSAFPED